MRVGPSDSLPTTSGRRPPKGSWVEVRDANDRTIYRRVLHNPIPYDVEVRSDSRTERLVHKRVDEPRGTLFLLVPDLQNATSVVLFGEGPPGDKERGTRELARFPLDEKPEVLS